MIIQLVDLMIGMVVVLLTDKRLTSYRNSANSRYVRIAAIDIEVLYETSAYSEDLSTIVYAESRHNLFHWRSAQTVLQTYVNGGCS